MKGHHIKQLLYRQISKIYVLPWYCFQSYMPEKKEEKKIFSVGRGELFRHKLRLFCANFQICAYMSDI